MEQRDRLDTPPAHRGIAAKVIVALAALMLACGDTDTTWEGGPSGADTSETSDGSADAAGLAAALPPPQPEPLLDDIGMGIGGVALDGEAAGDYAAGSFAAAGDLNGDGIDDFVIGAYGNDDAGVNAGRTYVVFGQPTFPAGPLALANVGSSVSGVSFFGEGASQSSGYSVGGGGDFNGDGQSDLLIGAIYADPSPGGTNSGRTYVVFGNPGLTGSDIPLYTIDYGYGIGNAYGVVINGENASDSSGYAIADVGDVNADGFDDVLISAPYADPNGSASGRTYLVYGGTYPAYGGGVDLADVAQGIGGVAFDGEAASDYSGTAVDGAGDVNGDGFADLVIGASYADFNGSGSGRVYIVYGGASLGSGPIQLSAVAAGTGGFALDGQAALDYAGWSVGAAGDVNDDGFDDVLVGAFRHDTGGTDVGRGYVVFGAATAPASPVALATIASGSGGIRLSGINKSDYTGWAVAGAGDVNLDGLADIAISATQRDPNGLSNAGTTFLAFGGDDPSLPYAGSILSGIHAGWVGGFTMEGEAASDNSGRALAGLGDINGDGVPDLGVGAAYADPNGSNSGRAYVVFGDPLRGTYDPAFNRRPQTEPDLHWIAQGASLTVPAPGVLDNDADADNDPLSVTPASFLTGSGATVTLYADGSFDFVPPHGQYWGEDTFEYTATDGQGGSAVEVVRIRSVPTAVPLDLVTVGEGGIAIDGAEDYDGAGQAVAYAGDLDGDGFGDALVGAHEADPNGLDSAGLTHVLYGSGGLKAGGTIVPSKAAVGISAFDWSGIAVQSAGDFNGDGLDDYVIGAIGTDANGNRSGSVYVVFGDAAAPTPDLTALDGSDGFVLQGAEANNDAGRSIAPAGDVNGDGLADLIVSAYRYPNGIERGRVYVIYGTVTPLASGVEALADVGQAGLDGFVLDGEWPGDFAGFGITGQVDLDDDGYDDVVVGAYHGDPAHDGTGRTYVVHGGPSLPSTIALADVANPPPMVDLGLVIEGEFAGDLSGRTLAGLGDINGDGIDDLMVGAPAASPTSDGAGRSYVLFGGVAFAEDEPDILLADVATGLGGFAIDGEADMDGAGASLTRLGDFNGDGYADLAIGAPLASSSSQFATGRVYVVLGRPDFVGVSVISLSDIAQGIGGFVIDGELTFDAAGHSVGGGGDINGDGYSDLLVGALNGGPTATGRAYLRLSNTYRGETPDGSGRCQV